jgi:hypothetical protein
MNKTSKILGILDSCISHIDTIYGIKLTKLNLLEFVRYFQDNPQGKIENEIDSYTVEFDVSEIEEAILTLPEYNTS